MRHHTRTIDFYGAEMAPMLWCVVAICLFLMILVLKGVEGQFPELRSQSKLRQLWWELVNGCHSETNLVRAQTTKLRNRLVNSYRFFISVSLGGCMGVPHLQRHKELGGKVGSTSDGRDSETILLVMRWGNWAAALRILCCFMVVVVVDGFIEVPGWLWVRKSWPPGDDWGWMAEIPWSKIVCDDKCDRDFFLVLLACPW